MLISPNATATIEFSKERTGKEINYTINSTPDSTMPQIQEGIRPEEQSSGSESSPPSTDSNIPEPKTFPNEKDYCSVNLADDNTFQGYKIKAGTNNADQLIGTANNDLILGLDGDDWIYGSGDEDVICGGKGHDNLFGESHPNEIIRQPGSPGKDFIFGREGNDTFNGGPESVIPESDIPRSGPGDVLHGGPGRDAFAGTDGNDYISAGDGSDGIFGGGGNDKLNGGNGNDYLYGGDGVDQLDGGPGDDKCDDYEGKPLPVLNCEGTSNEPTVSIWKKQPTAP